MIELIQKIQTTLEEAEDQFTTANLPPIAHIDKFRGQPTSTEFTYQTPALFIETKTIWDKVGKAYNGQLKVNFHIVSDADLGYTSEDPDMEEKFASETYYTLLRNIFDDLHAGDAGKLKRIKEKSADTSLINYQIIRYQCHYSDPIIAGSDLIEIEADESRSLLIEKKGLR